MSAPISNPTTKSGPTVRTWTARSDRRAIIEIPFRNLQMNPLCPHCLNEMSKAAASRNLFHCEPCRELIQFFGVSSNCGDAAPHFWPPIRRKRADLNVRTA